MISKDDIKHLAKLARIRISEDEAENMTKEIDSILEYVSQVKNISGKAEEKPILKNVMREDIVTRNAGEYTEDILKLAPSREGNYIKVKKILK